MNAYKIIFGVFFFLFGIFLLINFNNSITGNSILSFQLNENFNSIWSMILIVGGLFLMITGNLETKTNEKKYDGLIILGGNWRGYPYKFKTVKKGMGETLDISLRSKMNCITAAEMYKKGLTQKIIIGTGQSAGKKWPSEARAMKDYILKQYKDVPSRDILIHEKTLDTYSEVDEDIKLAGKNHLKNLALATVNTQLPRVKKYLENKGEHLDYISSEEEFKKLGPRYEKLVRGYDESLAVKYYETFKESILRGMQNMGLTKKVTKPIAKLIRS